MKSKLFSIFVFVLLGGLLKADLFERSNTQLAQDFGGGTNLGQFDDELKSNNAEKWIERCLKDAALKKYLYLEIREIGDDQLRDRLLLSYMRDHPYWDAAHTSLGDNKMYMAGHISDCMWIHFPSLKDEEAHRMALSYTLQSREGREAMAAIYERFLVLPEAERKEDNPKVVTLISEIKNAFVKYGTLEFLEPGSRRGPRKEAPREQSQLDPTSTAPPSAPAVAAKPKGSPCVQKIPFWIGEVIVAALFAWLIAKRAAPK